MITNKDNSIMKNFIASILLCLTIVGFIGGIGYSLYQSAWLIAVGQVVVGIMAFPKVKQLFKQLTA